MCVNMKINSACLLYTRTLGMFRVEEEEHVNVSSFCLRLGFIDMFLSILI